MIMFPTKKMSSVDPVKPEVVSRRSWVIHKKGTMVALNSLLVSFNRFLHDPQGYFQLGPGLRWISPPKSNTVSRYFLITVEFDDALRPLANLLWL